MAIEVVALTSVCSLKPFGWSKRRKVYLANYKSIAEVPAKEGERIKPHTDVDPILQVGSAVGTCIWQEYDLREGWATSETPGRSSRLGSA
jgi:hypothetical protein